MIARPSSGETQTEFRAHGQPSRLCGAAARADAARPLVAARTAGDRHRQDRRHLRPSGHFDGGQGRRQHGAVRRGARRHRRSRRRRPGLRQFRRFRHASTAIGATSRAMPRRSRPSTAACPRRSARLAAGDLIVLTADHGCDPTWRGTDHTRERVPVLGVGRRPPRRRSRAEAQLLPTSARRSQPISG